MAKIVEEIEVRADTTQATQATKTFEKSLVGSFAVGQIAAQAFTKAFSILVDQFKKGITDFKEYQKTTLQLETTLKRLGDVNGKWTSALQQQASQLQGLTGHSDEVIRRMQIMGLNMGVATDKIGPMIKAAVSLSNVMGRDVNETMKQLIQSTSGMAGELGRAVPAIRGLTKEQLEAGGAIDAINASMGDQVDALTKGSSGQALGLQNAWADLREEFVAVLDALAPVESAFQRIADWMLVNRKLGIESLIFMDADTLKQTAHGLREIESAQARLAMAQAKSDAGVLKGAGAIGAGRGRRGGAGGASGIDIDPTGYAEEERAAADARFEAFMADRERQYDAEAMWAQKTGELKDFYAQQDIERMDYLTGYAEAVSGAVTATMSQHLIGLAQGNEIAWKKSARSFAGALISAAGQALIAKGMAGLAESLMVAFTGGPTAAAGLAAASAKAVATGFAITAAGTALGGGAGHAALPGVGGVGGGTSTFIPSPEAYKKDRQQAGGGTTIIVNVEGAFSQAEAGREIRDALGAAARVGL